MSTRPSREDPSLVRLSEVAALITALVSVAAVIGLNRGTLIAVALPALAASGFVLIAGRRVIAIRKIPVNIALGGAAGVGKTVFANIVSSRLSEGNSKKLSFVPETLTAQHVYRAISGLQRGVWPSRTGKDSIDRYRGTVEFLHQPISHRLARGRIEFDLEIGDSAGELWDEMSHEMGPPPSRLIDSTFFEYVGDSTALIYFIDAETLQGNPEIVADHVNDLLSTLQVLRSIEGRGAQRLAKPISLLISKADLFSTVEIEDLNRTFSEVPERWEYSDAMFATSLRHLEHLNAVMERQVKSFSVHIVSSLQGAKIDGHLRPEQGSFSEVERPIEQILEEVLRSAG